MDLVLSGFRQLENLRRYYFDTTAEGEKRQRFSVDADLNLIHKYAIPLQELPLLCRRLLQGRLNMEPTIFTENDMLLYAKDRDAAADAMLKKRRQRHMGIANRSKKSRTGSDASNERGNFRG